MQKYYEYVDEINIRSPKLPWKYAPEISLFSVHKL
jgi:hypothetical protein